MTRKLMTLVLVSSSLTGCGTLTAQKFNNPFLQPEAPLVSARTTPPEPEASGRFTDRVVAEARAREGGAVAGGTTLDAYGRPVGGAKQVAAVSAARTQEALAPAVESEDLDASGKVEPAAGPVVGAKVPSAGAYPALKSTATTAEATHTVQPGETIYAIARKYNTKPDALLAVNNLKSSADIEEGMVLTIPSGEARLDYAADAHMRDVLKFTTQGEQVEPAAGQVLKPRADVLPAVHEAVAAAKAETAQSETAKTVTHTVAAGETVYRIGKQYGTSVLDILTANNLAKPEELQAGMKLVIPVSGEGTAVAEAAPEAAPQAAPAPAAVDKVMAAAEVKDTAPVIDNKAAAKDKALAKLSTVERGHVDKLAAAAKGFAWPVRGGEVVKSFGQEANGVTHTGINIVVPENTPVLATETGQVIYAGGGLKTYGNLVLIRHNNGLVSAYAHNAKLLVAKGERVQKGQVVALSGASGNVDKPQLHFEIRRNARAVNPMSVLASR